MWVSESVSVFLCVRNCAVCVTAQKRQTERERETNRQKGEGGKELGRQGGSATEE